MSPRGPAVIEDYDEKYIVDSGFLTIESALGAIYKDLRNSDTNPLDQLWNSRLQKYALKLDLSAQTAAEDVLRTRFADEIQIRGEESSLDKLKPAGLAALLDMLDGTDLLERNLGNWCSAMVIFDTGEPLIRAAFIGLPNMEIYYIAQSTSGAYVREPKAPNTRTVIRSIELEPKQVKFRDASICFYGQKPANFLSIMQNTRFIDSLNSFADEYKQNKDKPNAPQLRIYNLAGNPMMINLIEGRVDAIIELRGQRCHDVVPGFVIALRAGASLYNLDTKEKIDEIGLARSLNDPNQKFKYVMACSDDLAQEIIARLT